jgi:hypothetical protein
MAECKKCGYNEDDDRCEFCGGIEHTGTLGNYGGELQTMCCRKNPTKERRRLARLAAKEETNHE